MFCDGECEKDGKKCGQLTTLTLENKQKGEINTVTLCRFQAMLDSLLRMERNDIGIQAAIESQRNEEVKTGEKISKTMDTGFRRVAQATRESIIQLKPQKRKVTQKLLSLVKGD